MKRGFLLWNKNELPLEEFASRISKAKSFMASKKLDAVAIYGDANQSSNLSYLTNFFPYADTGIFILPLSGAPMLFTTHAYRNMPWFRKITWVEDIVCTNSMGEECLNYLKSIDLPEKKIGLIHTRAFPYPIYQIFQDQLSSDFIDVTDDYECLRSVKSEYELSFVKKASDIANKSFKKLNHILRPGISGYEIAAEIELTARGDGAEDIFCYIQPDNDQNGLTLPTTQEVKHFCSIELSVEYKGYWIKMGRTLLANESAAPVKESLEKFSKIYHEVTDSICSGQKTLEFYQGLKDRLTRIEDIKELQIQFDLGLEPYWTTHLNKNIDKYFEKNMILYLKTVATFQNDLNVLLVNTYAIQEEKPLQLSTF